MDACRSLEGFVAYGQLYDLWWKAPRDSLVLEKASLDPVLCPSEQIAPEKSCILGQLSSEETPDQTAAEMDENLCNTTEVPRCETESGSTCSVSLVDRHSKLNGCKVLLSEEFAALQNTQRDIAEVQQILADMIRQHQQQRNNLQANTDGGTPESSLQHSSETESNHLCSDSNQMNG